MAKKFSDFWAQMPPGARVRVETKVQKLLVKTPLNELRQAGGLLQRMLSEVLQVQQPATAEMERRTDMYVSILRSYIEATGDHPEVTARFPDGAVKISNFADIERAGA